MGGFFNIVYHTYKRMRSYNVGKTEMLCLADQKRIAHYSCHGNQAQTYRKNIGYLSTHEKKEVISHCSSPVAASRILREIVGGVQHMVMMKVLGGLEEERSGTARWAKSMCWSMLRRAKGVFICWPHNKSGIMPLDFRSLQWIIMSFWN